MSSTLGVDLKANAGKIHHMTLAAVTREGRRTFQAAYRAEGRPGYIVAFHDDPAQALALSMLVRRMGQPEEPGVRYWHHAESGCVWKTEPGEPDPRGDGEGMSMDMALVEEIDGSQYAILCDEYGKADEPFPVPEEPPAEKPAPQFDPDVEDFV